MNLPGCEVKEWDVPGMGKQLQITFMDADADVKSGTVYVPATASPAVIAARVDAKRAEFKAAAILRRVGLCIERNEMGVASLSAAGQPDGKQADSRKLSPGNSGARAEAGALPSRTEAAVLFDREVAA